MIKTFKTRAFCVLCALCLAAPFASSRPAFASSVPTPGSSRLCEAAVLGAAQRWRVPPDVLRAITLAETGRNRDGTMRPWPWTVNMEGRGVWFDTRREAEHFVKTSQARGARSFDIGCFQINHHWHGRAFPSVEAMFDPDLGADYAARFLSELHAELGDWSRAAGAYHSRTPEHAHRYRARFDEIRARIGAVAELPRTDAVTSTPTKKNEREIRKRNTFPLLQSSGSPLSAGSLVPLSGSYRTDPLLPAG